MRRRVLYIHYTNPGGYSPLEHSTRMLADAGWEVLFLCTGAFGADELRFAEHPRVRLMRMPFVSAGWRQKLQYACFVAWVIGWGWQWRPRWVYASDPLACLPALALSYMRGIQVAYHEHDSPRAGASSLVSRVGIWSRRRLALRASLRILPNAQRARRFAEEVLHGDAGGARPILTVWNCPMRAEAEVSRVCRPPGTLQLAYQGSIVPERLPVSLLEALHTLPDAVRLQVVGYETVAHRGYVDFLRETARHLQLDHRVEFLGALPLRKDMLDRARACDVGVSLMPMRPDDRDVVEMAGASIKSFDYLACGLALLVSDVPAWRHFFVDPGYAVACNPEDPASIAAALRWMLQHPVELRQMAEGGRRRILDEWNYGLQFRSVFERMTGA